MVEELLWGMNVVMARVRREKRGKTEEMIALSSDRVYNTSNYTEIRTSTSSLPKLAVKYSVCVFSDMQSKPSIGQRIIRNHHQIGI